MDMMIFIVGFLVLIVGVVTLAINAIKKKPKKKNGIMIAIALVLMIIGLSMPNENNVAEDEPIEEKNLEEVEKVERVIEEDAEEVAVEIEDEDENEDKEDELTWDDLKENIVGNSNKDYKEVTDRKPRDVRNDVTGKWKITTIAENVDLIEYANSYKNSYMKDGDVHYIINFNYNTTTKLYYSSEILYVDITEYEDKEEHDASDLGSGMLLKQYWIYPDGDIEEIQ